MPQLSFVLGLKIALIECRKFEDFAHFESAINSTGNVYKSSTYAEIHTHVTNSMNQLQADKLFEVAIISAFVFDLVDGPVYGLFC